MASHQIINALDALACALAEHGHKWSIRERSLYSRAILLSSRKGFDLSASKKRSSHEPSIEPMLLFAQVLAQ